MTRAVLPMMLNRKTGYQKYVINVGGLLGGVNPSAGFAIYGATKAFNDSFSQALHKEYKDSGIFVQARATQSIFKFFFHVFIHCVSELHSWSYENQTAD
jgi:short-subunit dehydrogenase